MGKIVDINERKRNSRNATTYEDHSVDDDLPDIDNSMFWLDSVYGESGAAMTELPPPRIAAIMVKGCFGLYHLVRQHRRRRTRVPEYLLHFARDCEEPIIPAAEVTYFKYYCEGGAKPDEIPDDLYLLGCVECEDAAKCSCHALRLHRLLEAFARASRTAQRDFIEVFPVEQSRPLMRAMFAEHRLWSTAKGNLTPI